MDGRQTRQLMASSGNTLDGVSGRSKLAIHTYGRGWEFSKRVWIWIFTNPLWPRPSTSELTFFLKQLA